MGGCDCAGLGWNACVEGKTRFGRLLFSKEGVITVWRDFALLIYS